MTSITFPAEPSETLYLPVLPGTIPPGEGALAREQSNYHALRPYPPPGGPAGSRIKNKGQYPTVADSMRQGPQQTSTEDKTILFSSPDPPPHNLPPLPPLGGA